MRLKGRRNTYHVEVAKCAMFATPSSLNYTRGETSNPHLATFVP